MMANHQIEILIEPNLLYVEQNDKIVKMVYKDRHVLVLTFKTIDNATTFFNDSDFTDQETSLLAYDAKIAILSPSTEKVEGEPNA